MKSDIAKEIVFIAGLGRSGSTLMDLIVGGLPGYVGVGEVFQLIRPDTHFLDQTGEIMCSCGLNMDKCDFWSQVIPRLRSNKNETPQKKYEIFLQYFREIYGNNYIPVDSSKTLRSLATLRSIQGINIKVIYLIRDVRGWTISWRDTYRRTKEFSISDLIKKHGTKAWKGFINRTSIFCFWVWYYRNREMQRFLKRENVLDLQLGYEELALYSEYSVNLICSFLDAPNTDSVPQLSDSKSHSILGNRMRSQKEKKQGIFYDNRWFYKSDWTLPSVLFPNIMRYNNNEVYRNVRNQLWAK